VLALVASSVGKDCHWWITGAAAPLRVRDGRRGKRREKMVGPTVWRGGWRASKNGGWEWEFGGVWKIEVHMEALLEFVFCSKPPNFGVEAHIEAPTGVALSKYPVVHATRSTVIVILCKYIVTVTVKSKR
jgi:hypothetical protein